MLMKSITLWVALLHRTSHRDKIITIQMRSNNYDKKHVLWVSKKSKQDRFYSCLELDDPDDDDDDEDEDERERRLRDFLSSSLRTGLRLRGLSGIRALSWGSRQCRQVHQIILDRITCLLVKCRHRNWLDTKGCGTHWLYGKNAYFYLTFRNLLHIVINCDASIITLTSGLQALWRAPQSCAWSFPCE